MLAAEEPGRPMARIRGTITEEHLEVVVEVFGHAMRNAMDEAPEGSTFLSILVESGRFSAGKAGSASQDS